MSDERPPDDHDNDRDPDDRVGEPTEPNGSSDDAPVDAPATNDSSDSPDDERTRDALREGQADGGHSDERVPPEQRDREPETEPEAAEPSPGGVSDRVAFWISALIGLVLAVGAVALVSGRAPFFEDVLRVRPTVEGGGVGADWVVGNTEPVLEALIAIVHFADVVMGIFILVMVFIHWAAFRRLGARMQPPSGARTRETATATDGGEPNDVRRSSSDQRSDGDDGDGGDRA